MDGELLEMVTRDGTPYGRFLMPDGSVVEREARITVDRTVTSSDGEVLAEGTVASSDAGTARA